MTITSTTKDGLDESVIVTTPVELIERAAFFDSSYMLRIQGHMYDMQILHYKKQGAVMNDLLNAETSDLASTFVDTKSAVEHLISFVKSAVPEKNLCDTYFFKEPSRNRYCHNHHYSCFCRRHGY